MVYFSNKRGFDMKSFKFGALLLLSAVAHQGLQAQELSSSFPALHKKFVESKAEFDRNFQFAVEDLYIANRLRLGDSTDKVTYIKDKDLVLKDGKLEPVKLLGAPVKGTVDVRPIIRALYEANQKAVEDNINKLFEGKDDLATESAQKKNIAGILKLGYILTVAENAKNIVASSEKALASFKASLDDLEQRYNNKTTTGAQKANLLTNILKGNEQFFEQNRLDLTLMGAMLQSVKEDADLLTQWAQATLEYRALPAAKKAKISRAAFLNEKELNKDAQIIDVIRFELDDLVARGAVVAKVTEKGTKKPKPAPKKAPSVAADSDSEDEFFDAETGLEDIASAKEKGGKIEFVVKKIKKLFGAK